LPLNKPRAIYNIRPYIL